jgi:type II secretory pathway component GspD/PulD (secretin)
MPFGLCLRHCDGSSGDFPLKRVCRVSKLAFVEALWKGEFMKFLIQFVVLINLACLMVPLPVLAETKEPITLPIASETLASAPAATSAMLPTESANTNAPTISSQESPDGLRMNFRGAPLNMVLDYLSDAAGFIINKTADVRGTVEVWSKQPVTKDEAVELLSSVLKKNGYGVTRNGRILTILAMDTAKTSSELPVVTGIEPEDVEKSDEIETRIIPVRYANVTQLVPNLQLLLPTSATLAANESANTLILVATKSDIKRMLKIVQALDTSIASVSTIKVIPLQYSDAKDTAAMITQLFAQNSNPGNGNFGGGPNFGGPGGPGGGPGGFFRAAMQAAANANARNGNAAATRVVAVADERSNSVVVSAAPGMVSAIEDMLKELDRQVADETELRVFKLTNADPTELADQLTKLFPDETNSANNNNNNNPGVPFFRRGPFGQVNNANASNTSDRSRKMGKVLAVPDPRTACLIVTASKTLMPQIADMIAELDSNKGKKEVVSYFELQNADPQDVYQNLQDLFNRSTVRMQNNNNRNSLLGANNPLTLRETTGNQQPTIGSTLSRSAMGASGAGGVGAIGR